MKMELNVLNVLRYLLLYPLVFVRLKGNVQDRLSKPRYYINSRMYHVQLSTLLLYNCNPTKPVSFMSRLTLISSTSFFYL